MKRESMSDKELKLLAAARREAAAARGTAALHAKPAMARPPATRPAPTSPLDARTVVGWDATPAGATPLDQPTVAGWDHPAARGATDGKDADGKWSRIAALMESERAKAMEKRRRAKRATAIFLGVLLVVVALVAARVLLSR
jgi:hypothetical protein